MLYKWRHKAQGTQVGSAGLGAGERHYKKAAIILAPQQRRAMIQSIHTSAGHSVRLVCETLDLPCGSYHYAARPAPGSSAILS